MFFPIPNFYFVRVSVYFLFELLLVSASRGHAYRLLQGCQDPDFAAKIALLYYFSRFSMFEHMQDCYLRIRLGSLGKIANPCEFEPQNLTRDSFIFVSWIEPAIREKT